MAKKIKICFVCSGNVFRSMAAEYLMKNRLYKQGISAFQVSSAGITAKTQEISPIVLASLKERGIDASGHKQTKLTQEIVDDTDLLIAMGINHQVFIQDTRWVKVPVFNELDYREHTPVYDVEEAIQDYATNPQAVEKYERRAIHHIEKWIPYVIKSIQDLFHI